MSKYELTGNQVGGIIAITIIFVLFIGILFGIYIEKIMNIENFQVSVYQTRGNYLHLPNGTLWKKLSEVTND